ncbi:very short patch repair endonuclease [Streptomyces sp. BF23-19]|uniref:very short patch repair endonuclease n=1 Tax=Streptomyces sp. BF23-19 TaxID=3240283 RepID=UPI0034E612BF
MMAAQRSRDTKPELALRRALHALGFRYRVHLPIPGMPRRRADVTFTRWRTAVFVQGCFWHACQKHLHAPKHNSDWWQQKLQNNVRRDEETDTHLVLLGWLPLRIWEHESVDGAVGRVTAALAARDHPLALRLGVQDVIKPGLVGPPGSLLGAGKAPHGRGEGEPLRADCLPDQLPSLSSESRT